MCVQVEEFLGELGLEGKPGDSKFEYGPFVGKLAPTLIDSGGKLFGANKPNN